MKKKFILTIIIGLLLQTTIMAQNFDLKSYRDYSQDFSGASAALYIGELDSDLQTEFYKQLDLFSEQLEEVKKLTKNNNWLLSKAMNEWDFQQGELYLVFLAENKYSDHGIFIFVQVDDNNHYVWRGWKFSDDDFEALSEFFENQSFQ